MNTTPTPKIVYVRWLDACSHEALDSPPVSPALCELHEVGFLIGESADVVTIGMETSAEDVAPGRWRLHIPRVSIQEMKVIELSEFIRRRKPRRHARV